MNTEHQLVARISAVMHDAAERAIKDKVKAAGVQAMIFGAAVRELTATIADLKDRLKAVEDSPMVYDGPHEIGKTYSKGTFVTRDGSLWHCNEKTNAQPGDGRAWTLAVKRGKDGKDWNAR